MTSKQQFHYSQVQSRYEVLRTTARDVAHEGLPDVMSNKRGAAILKSHIGLEGITISCQRELRKWENSGARRVA